MLFPFLGAQVSGAGFQYPDFTRKELCGQMANQVQKVEATNVSAQTLGNELISCNTPGGKKRWRFLRLAWGRGLGGGEGECFGLAVHGWKLRGWG